MPYRITFYFPISRITIFFPLNPLDILIRILFMFKALMRPSVAYNGVHDIRKRGGGPSPVLFSEVINPKIN